MPGGQKRGPSVKDDKTYEAVRNQGASKEKAARIANASARRGRKPVGRRGGKTSRYEAMTRQEVYDRAKSVGIEGRSSMSKSELISALRNH